MKTTISRWEERDLLSFTKVELDKTEHDLVNKIVRSLLNNEEITWRQLTLPGEALVQQQLRLRGYDLRCANLDIFPTSSKVLSTLIRSYSFKLRIQETIKLLWYGTIRPTIYKFCRSITNLTYLFASSTYGVKSTILIFVLLMWFHNMNYLLYALALAFVVSNCMTIVIHEYWVHNQVKPKNRIIGFIFDYVGHLLVGDRISWSYAHAYHHKHWKTSKDVEIDTMLSYNWVEYLAIASPVHGNPAHTRAIANSRESMITKMLPESQFLQRHEVPITIISHLVLLFTIGVIMYVYFILFQIWLFHKYIAGFNELVTHYNNKTAQQEQDTPYLFPICCGTAYHKSHHTLTDSIILGPGWVKYFNIQYYFTKLFYNITAKVPNKYNSSIKETYV